MPLGKDSYAICGLGVTKHGQLPNYTTRQVAAWALDLALADSGLQRKDIDGYIYLSTFQDPALSDCRYLGITPKFAWYMDTGGATASSAVIAACGALDAGLATHVLLMGTHRPWSLRTRIGAGGYGIARAWGLASAVSTHAFHAQLHMHTYGTTIDHLGAVAVTQREYACQRPEAVTYGQPMTMANHHNSPIICDPLRRLDCTRDTDGGVAILLTTGDRARNLKAKPVSILGAGLGHNIRRWHDKRCFLGMDCATARDPAFRMAGITIEDVNVFNCYDAFTINVILQLEGYGFCGEGEGGPFVLEGNTRLNGRIPTNTAGGQLSGWYIMGMTPLAEGIRQMSGKAGATQVKDAEIGLVTGHGGNAGIQNTWAHGCLVLKRGL